MRSGQLRALQVSYVDNCQYREGGSSLQRENPKRGLGTFRQPRSRKEDNNQKLQRHENLEQMRSYILIGPANKSALSYPNEKNHEETR